MRSPDITYLPPDGQADWILFGTPVDFSSHPRAMLDSRFRREFQLNTQPQHAHVKVRGARKFEIQINGHRLEPRATRNWKSLVELDVSDALLAGGNVIEARVFNDIGPPLLWLCLSTDERRIRSDQTWQVSLTGSSWRPAVSAAASKIPQPGNRVAGGESTFAALRQVWPAWLCFAAVAAGALIVLRWAQFHLRDHGPAGAALLVVLPAALWLLLSCHNARLLPVAVGFDAKAHLNYIKFLQERHALPLPRDGIQMFQAPLFYATGAALLSALGSSVNQPAGILILRSMTMCLGVIHFVLVFLTLRLLLPQQRAAQLVGLGLAAFLPMNLYLSHYCTNETLLALLVSASLYQSVRILKAEAPSWIRFALLGLTLGAAALTKFTGYLVLPFVAIALTRQLWSVRAPACEWAKELGLVCLIAVAVSSWHYVRIAHATGSLVIGGWDPASGFSWWQDEGYRVADYYGRFGRSLFRPFFSAASSFFDGIYATLWGDGLGGGVSDLSLRVPWQYDFMCAGYLLSLVPTFVILAGLVATLSRFVRHGDRCSFLLLGVTFVLSLGLFYLSLSVPAYASIKAFYGLFALTALAFFAAIGWTTLTRGRKTIRFVLALLLIVWAMNSFAAFYIRDSAPLHLYLGLRRAIEGEYAGAQSEMQKAIAQDATSSRWKSFLATALDDAGRNKEALPWAEAAVKLDPQDSGCRFELGRVLARGGDFSRALPELQSAVELGPENAAAWDLLPVVLFQTGATDDAISAARDGVAISPYNADSHYVLGATLARKADFAAATNQFAYALLLRPDFADALKSIRRTLLAAASTPQGVKELETTAPDSPMLLGDLAWLLATNPDDSLRDGVESARLAERACELTGYKVPELLASLAAAYAETGRFTEALNTAEQSLALARRTQSSEAVVLAENLLPSIRVHEPYREHPASP